MHMQIIITVHDFYYAEGNIYMKLQQLEKDKDVIASSTAGQYENKRHY